MSFFISLFIHLFKDTHAFTHIILFFILNFITTGLSISIQLNGGGGEKTSPLSALFLPSAQIDVKSVSAHRL